MIYIYIYTRYSIPGRTPLDPLKLIKNIYLTPLWEYRALWDLRSAIVSNSLFWKRPGHEIWHLGLARLDEPGALSILYYIALHNIILYDTVLYSIIQYYNVLYCIILCYIALYCIIILYRSIRYYMVAYCIICVLPHNCIMLSCMIPPYILVYCITRHHTVSCSVVLHYTAL